MTQQVSDIYYDAEFSQLLEDAKMNAANDWEENFVADLTKKFEEHGFGTYLSDLQNDRLKRIAAWGEL